MKCSVSHTHSGYHHHVWVRWRGMNYVTADTSTAPHLLQRQQQQIARERTTLTSSIFTTSVGGRASAPHLYPFIPPLCPSSAFLINPPLPLSLFLSPSPSESSPLPPQSHTSHPLLPSCFPLSSCLPPSRSLLSVSRSP